MALEQMRVAGDQAGLETPFPQCAGAVVRPIHMAHVAPAERLHHATYATEVRRRHQQVDMVGHQHVGMDRATFALCDFVEIAQVTTIVVRREEARLAVVAALDDVLCDAGKIESGWAGHADIQRRMPGSSRTGARLAIATCPLSA